jgi:hypothetical protein
MKFRSFAVLVACATSAFTVFGADPENPYKRSKVGDSATYKVTLKIAQINIEGTLTQTVIAKDESKVKVKTTGTVGGGDIQPQEQDIDLTKPFDPTKVPGNPAGANVKVEKTKDGTERVKAGSKEYECKWESFKLQASAMGMEFESVIKVWQGKDMAIPMVKMEMSGEVGGQRIDILLELADAASPVPVAPKK